MINYILTNTFHNTECAIRSDAPTIEQAWDDLMVAGLISPSTRGRRRYLRVWRELCGQEDCRCGVWRPR